MNIFKLKGKAILSPMAGVTDAAFRILAKRYGAGLVYTELISSAALVRAINKTNYLIQTSEEEKPVGIQLFGNNAEEVVEAAKIVQDKFDFIDINCGCPAWSVIRTGSGSELLKNPEKIKIFVENLVKNVNIPITVKIRIGINDKNINAVKVAKEADIAICESTHLEKDKSEEYMHMTAKEAGEVAKGSLRSEINQPNGEIFKKLAKLSFRA